MPAPDFSKHIQIAALGNVIIALAKLAAALWSGSTAMMATTVHALADTSSLGMVIRDRASDPGRSPHARIYFSSYVVAILVFAMGAGVTITHGIERLRVPLPQQDASAGMLVITAGILFHLVWRWRMSTLLPTLSGPASTEPMPSRDPVAHTAMLMNAAALFGGGLALASLAATAWMPGSAAEAWASIAIGLTQGFTAARLAISTKVVLGQLQTSPAPVQALRPADEPRASNEGPTSSPVATAVAITAAPAAEAPKRNHPPPQPGRKAKKRRR